MTAQPTPSTKSSNRKWLLIILGAFVLLIAVVAAVVLGSQRSAANKEQAEFACVNLDAANRQGQGLVQPYGFALEQLGEQYGLSPGDAADRVDEALDGTCPELRVLVPRR